MRKKSIRDVELAGKRVLVRVDYNVPLNEAGGVTDNSRIRETLPTLRYLQQAGCRIVLVSHLGRPEGKADPRLSLAPVAEELAALLEQPVLFAADTIGPDAQSKTAGLSPGSVLLLENVRFYPEEEANDPEFAAELAKLGDVFVNDAFGAAHRAHASTAGVAAHLSAVAGFLMEKEIDILGRVLEDPARPLLAVVGGAKVSSKIGVLRNLLPRVDGLVIGGGMACTFLKARGLEVGRSLIEEGQVSVATEVMEESGSRLSLPVDGLCADRVDPRARTLVVDVEHIPSDMAMVDIGPRSIQEFARAIASAGTILWNGPMGIFEMEPFAEGTRRIAEAVAASRATTVVGGGDTVAAIERYSDPARFTHVSTGGGASLELLEGRVLPGVEALEDR